MSHRSWDGVERRRETPSAWNAEVDTQLAEGKKVMDELRKDLATNTAATERIEKSTNALVSRADEMDKKLTPIFEAWDTLQTGLRVLGGIGRAGMWIARHWKIFVGVGAFVWAWLHGASIESAVKAFWKELGR